MEKIDDQSKTVKVFPFVMYQCNYKLIEIKVILLGIPSYTQSF